MQIIAWGFGVVSRIQKWPRRSWRYRLCRWCWYRPVAAWGVVRGVYATARPEEDTAHPHVSVWIKSPPWLRAGLCGRIRWGGGRNRKGVVRRLKPSWHCSRIWERNTIRIGQECELWGCQLGIMRRVCNTGEPGANENTLTSTQHITHSVSKHRTVTCQLALWSLYDAQPLPLFHSPSKPEIPQYNIILVMLDHNYWDFLNVKWW